MGEAAEAAAELAEDDGNVLEPFNMAQEREEGHFDESGHYIENKEDDGMDAWAAEAGGAPLERQACRTYPAAAAEPDRLTCSWRLSPL